MVDAEADKCRLPDTHQEPWEEGRTRHSAFKADTSSSYKELSFQIESVYNFKQNCTLTESFLTGLGRTVPWENHSLDFKD